MPLTAERIAGLPAAEQPAWKEYLARSKKQMLADQDFFSKELKSHGMKEPINAPSGHSAHDISLKHPAEWFGESEGAHIADIIVSFQTPAGGWSKNLGLSDHVRAPGERFSSDGAPKGQLPTDNDYPVNRSWNYVGTFDNSATTTELYFLADVISALHGHDDEKYRKAFMHGVDYIFAAQYPNGGWPQVWPLQGGYHDAITYNDGAMIHVMEFLQGVSEGSNEFSFVPPQIRAEAAEHLQHGLKCVVKTQIVANGHPTIWAQQYDPLTLEACSARNYEMPALAAGESGEMGRFLMQIPNPDPEIVKAVHAAAAWFEKSKVMGYQFVRHDAEDHSLVPMAGAGPIWPRYSEIGTDRAIFGDRDKTIHDNLNDISKERRNGYSWYGKGPLSMLEKYADWSTKHPKS